MKPSVRSNLGTLFRWTATGVFGGLGLAFASACSSPPIECSPPIPPGARFQVTVIRETPESNACHVVNLQSTFQITAAKEEPSAAQNSCNVTPASWAPDQRGVSVIRCQPSASQMLGTECEMNYASTCRGTINFYFYAPIGSGVNWSAPQIRGARFRIQDFTSGCIPNVSDCLDEYEVMLDRLPDLPTTG